MSFDVAISRIGEIKSHIATLMPQSQVPGRTGPQSPEPNPLGAAGVLPMGGPIMAGGTGQRDHTANNLASADATNFSELLSQELSRALGTTGLGAGPAGVNVPGTGGQSGRGPGAVANVDAVGNAGSVPQLPATGTGLADQVIAEAKTWLGVPYKWGGNTRAGVDCSGFTKNVMAKFGVNLPRVARQQMTQGTAVASLDQARPGDLVVFKNGKHIGIYVGDGKMIDAPRPGKNVQVRDVYETPTTIRRVL